MRSLNNYLILAKNAFKTTTFRQSTVTFSGTFVNGALGAVFYVLVARFLGPASFGLFTIAVTTLTLVSDIGDLGTDTGLVRFVGENIKKDEKKAFQFLKLGFEVKVFVGLVVLVFGFLFAPFIARELLAKPELVVPLRISFLGVIGVFLYSLVIRVLQAYQKFVLWSGIQIGTNLIRVVAIITLYLFFRANTTNTLVIYISMPFIGFLAGLFLIPIKFLKVKGETHVAKEFFQYNKWVASFILVAAFSSRLDTFISARLLSLTEIGIYAAANQLTAIVTQISTAISTVISPKMASMGSKDNLIIYLKKTQAMVVILSIFALLAIPMVTYLIPIIFGVGYISSGPIFIVLLLASLVYLISVPIHMSVFYYFYYSRFFITFPIQGCFCMFR